MYIGLSVNFIESLELLILLIVSWLIELFSSLTTTTVINKYLVQIPKNWGRCLMTMGKRVSHRQTSREPLIYVVRPTSI